jgi:hypothetical protein
VTTKINQIVQDNFTQEDTDVLYKINYPVNGSRIRHLVFRNTNYTISGWTGDKFPNVIYICLGGFTDGYRRFFVQQDGSAVLNGTSRVAALELCSATSMLDESSVRTYELKYELRDTATWELPSNLVDLKLHISADMNE